MVIGDWGMYSIIKYYSMKGIAGENSVDGDFGGICGVVGGDRVGFELAKLTEGIAVWFC
nr:hypothetical protein [Sphaerospermopsis sp. LEGE 08334]